MPTAVRQPSGRDASAPSSGDLRAVRRLLLIAGIVYGGWWFVVEAVLPGAYNPAPGRFAVVAAFLAVYAASFVVEGVRRHLAILFEACGWLLTAHYYYLFDHNEGDMPWAVGAYVVAVAVGACVTTRPSLLAYSTLTVALGVAVSFANRRLLHTIFLPGLATMLALTNFTLHSRLLLEQERAQRLRGDAARALAEAGVALRDEFIAVASHELRTPLTSLQLAVQGLKRAVSRDDRAMDAEALRRSVDLCVRQTVSLTRLVDRLLDASRLTDGALALHIEAFSLNEVVRDVARSLSVDATRSGSAIEVVDGSQVSGRWDRMRLEQVVTNLLRNAITFAPGKPIRVTVAEDGDRAHLEVADEGMGIEPEAQARIFGRFERAVSSRNYGGMGLGLYVVAKIVEAHGGGVRVESEPGKGATFIVDLPRGGESGRAA